MQPRIMYIEKKTDGLKGEGRVGFVEFSKSGKTIYYQGRVLAPAGGSPLKANYYDKETHEDYWVSAPRSDGNDSLFSMEIQIDEDTREEYWNTIRKQPKLVGQRKYRSKGKSKAERENIEKGLRRRQMDNGWMPSKNA